MRKEQTLGKREKVKEKISCKRGRQRFWVGRGESQSVIPQGGGSETTSEGEKGGSGKSNGRAQKKHKKRKREEERISPLLKARTMRDDKKVESGRGGTQNQQIKT